MTRPSFDETRDFYDAEFEREQRRLSGIDHQSLPASGLIAFLVGAWFGGLVLLLILWAVEAAPTFGKLNGCETLSAAECQAFAAEGL